MIDPDRDRPWLYITKRLIKKQSLRGRWKYEKYDDELFLFIDAHRSALQAYLDCIINFDPMIILDAHDLIREGDWV